MNEYVHATVRFLFWGLWIIAAALALIFVGALVRTHILTFAAIWIAAPLMGLGCYLLYDSLTLSALRAQRAILMTTVCVISFGMINTRKLRQAIKTGDIKQASERR